MSGTSVEAWGQLAGISSLLVPCEFQGIKLGCQVWQKVPESTDHGSCGRLNQGALLMLRYVLMKVVSSSLQGWPSILWSVCPHHPHVGITNGGYYYLAIVKGVFILSLSLICAGSSWTWSVAHSHLELDILLTQTKRNDTTHSLSQISPNDLFAVLNICVIEVCFICFY